MQKPDAVAVTIAQIFAVAAESAKAREPKAVYLGDRSCDMRKPKLDDSSHRAVVRRVKLRV